MTSSLQIIGVDGIGDVQPSDNLVAVITAALHASEIVLVAGDILVVTHKIVSKAEGRLVDLRRVQPSPFAVQWSERYGKDPRQTEVVLREATRVVRMDRGVIIAETRHGLICANAAVDASNIPGDTVCLLPRDPDASAAALRAALRERVGLDVPVIISDSFGRAWRMGIVNVAIGVSGLAPLTDYRGEEDPHGRTLHASILAVADELAAAAELVTGKVDGRPVALIRGYPFARAEGSGRDLLLDPARDLFR